MRALTRPPPGLKLLSRRALGELGTLQTSVQELAGQRGAALRMFLASRNATTLLAQREFWLEFAWADQEYRVAVRRLAQFCLDRRAGVDARRAAQRRRQQERSSQA